jgi:cell division protein FtsW (lipid II flippase)
MYFAELVLPNTVADLQSSNQTQMAIIVVLSLLVLGAVVYFTSRTIRLVLSMLVVIIFGFTYSSTRSNFASEQINKAKASPEFMKQCKAFLDQTKKPSQTGVSNGLEGVSNAKTADLCRRVSESN